MYDVWDADTGQLLSAGHATIDTATAVMDRIRHDVARDVEATGDGASEIILSMEVRDAAGEVLVTDWGGVSDTPAPQHEEYWVPEG